MVDAEKLAPSVALMVLGLPFWGVAFVTATLPVFSGAGWWGWLSLVIGFVFEGFSLRYWLAASDLPTNKRG